MSSLGFYMGNRPELIDEYTYLRDGIASVRLGLNPVNPKSALLRQLPVEITGLRLKPEAVLDPEASPGVKAYLEAAPRELLRVGLISDSERYLSSHGRPDALYWAIGTTDGISVEFETRIPMLLSDMFRPIESSDCQVCLDADLALDLRVKAVKETLRELALELPLPTAAEKLVQTIELLPRDARLVLCEQPPIFNGKTGYSWRTPSNSLVEKIIRRHTHERYDWDSLTMTITEDPGHFTAVAGPSYGKSRVDVADEGLKSKYHIFQVKIGAAPEKRK